MRLNKQFRAIIAVAMMFCGVITSFANRYEINGICYSWYSGMGDTFTVTYKGDSYNAYKPEDQYKGDIVIPETVEFEGKTYRVTKIDSYAFYSDPELTSVKIPNTITNIGYCAFAGCDGLTSVTIGSGVTTIEERAFSGCDGLTSVVIPNSVTKITSGAFSGCRSLRELILSDGPKKLQIGRYNGEILEHNNNKTLHFDSCPIEKLYVGRNLSFYNAQNSDYDTDHMSPFRYSPLTTLEFGDSVTNIAEYSFAKCELLTSVTIPININEIGNYAFSECKNLNEVICESWRPATASYYTFYNVPTTATLYVPFGSRGSYAIVEGWSSFSNIIELEPEKTTITIMDATNQGSVSFSYEEGKAFDFTVTPVTGYIVNTVLVNGEICEAEDGVYNIESVSEKTTISVSYELDPETGVSTLSINNIKVYGCDNTLTVTGVEFGDKISVYDLNGTQIYTQNSVGYTNSISLNNNGVYIVKVNGKSFKVML